MECHVSGYKPHFTATFKGKDLHFASVKLAVRYLRQQGVPITENHIRDLTYRTKQIRDTRRQEYIDAGLTRLVNVKKSKVLFK